MLGVVSVLLSGASTAPVQAEGDGAGAVRFLQPTRSELSGLVDLEVTAPAGTAAVRFSLDGIAFAELTDLYAKGTKTEPVWRTATDASWFPSGRHVLRAEAVTPGGIVTADKRVTTTRPPAPRGVTRLAGAWRFAVADELPPGTLDGALDGDAAPGTLPGFDDPALTPMLVPSSFGAVRDRWNAYQGEIALYRKTVHLDPPGRGQRTLLEVDSCYFACAYFVNGQHVGSSRGGYLPVRLDVTGAAHPGGNVLAVVADNRLGTAGEHGIGTWLYWQWGGILAEPRLRRTRAVELLDVTAEGTAAGQLTLRAHGVNATGRPVRVRAEVTVAEPDGDEALDETPVTFHVSPDGQARAVTLGVGDPDLWSLEEPTLHTVTVEPRDRRHGGTLTTRAGFRDVTTRHGDLLLNGKVMRDLAGVNRHIDYPGLGRTEPAGLVRRELKRLHDKGFRLLRSGHYPSTPAFLDAADELGFLVVGEVNVHQATAEQLATERIREFAKLQLGKMIRRDRGHPSVIVWSVGNENHTATPEGAGYVREVIAHGRRRDPNRLFTQVTNQSTGDRSFADQDIVFANIYAGWYVGEVGEARKWIDLTQEAAGGKPIVLAEYGAEAVAGRPGHGRGTEFYQGLIIDGHNRVLRGRPNFVGLMYWTSTEFMWTPHGGGGNPEPVPGFHNKGLLTWYREPKLGWRVFFAPVRIRPLREVTASPDGRLVNTPLRITVEDARGRGGEGTLRITPPPGITADRTEIEFDVPAGGHEVIEVRLTGQLDTGERTTGQLRAGQPDTAAADQPGMVRAVIGADTEAQPQLFNVVPEPGV